MHMVPAPPRGRRSYPLHFPRACCITLGQEQAERTDSRGHTRIRQKCAAEPLRSSIQAGRYLVSYRPCALAALWAFAAFGFQAWPASTAAQTQAPIGFMQGNYSVPQTPQSSVTVVFPGAQSAGNLNVVIVGWNDSTALVTSVNDTKGNAYNLAIGPTVLTGQASQAIYFAPNIAAAAANSNIVTVRFSAAAVYPDVRVLEYSGLDPVSPLHAVTASSGSGTSSSSGTLTASVPNVLLVAGNIVATSTSGPGASFTNRMITNPDGDIAEGRVAATAGSYSATAPLSSSGYWIMQMAAFKAQTLGTNTAPTISSIPAQVTNEDTPSSTIGFTVGDAETPAANLTVSGSSSIQTLVPNANIVFGGTGANRTVTLTPAANQFGTATITVTVSDGQLSTSTSFQLTVNSVNDAPTITGIGNQTTTAGTAVGPINFTVGDVETPAGSLTLSGGSSNPTLMPNANIVFGGSGANRTVTLTPAAGQTGTAAITLTVSDGQLSTSTGFQLTVNATNSAPTISNIPAQVTNEDTPSSTIGFTVGDAETAPGSLTVSGGSSDLTLVPNANIVFGGTGANRTVTLTPAANQFGTATITVTVSDGQLSTSTSFQLTVNSVNDAPTITGIGNQTTTAGTAVGPINFTVGDVETPAGSLTVSGGSSNPTLMPNANIVFGGSGANRTVTLTPAAGQTGTAAITLTVSDGQLSTSTGFQLTVNATNSAPTITNIPAQVTNEDTPSSTIGFTVGDAETPAANLTVSGSSSIQTLVPNANIVFGGTGANRTVTLTPAANQFGTATITVTVSDGQLSTSTSFQLTVNSVNDAPTITGIG